MENKVKEHIEISIEESKEKIDRQKNLILYNIPEDDSELESTNCENDSIKVKEVLNFVCSDIKPENLKKTSMSRLGPKRTPSEKYPTPKPRPIRVNLEELSHRGQILRNARKLKNNENFKTIGLAADKTKIERISERNLRTKLSQQRSEGLDVIIKNGEIVPRPNLHSKSRNQSSAKESQPSSPGKFVNNQKKTL